MKYSIEKIAGIDCIFIPMDWAHSVTTRVLVRAGSDYETDREWGISHFLEHLSMNGGKKWKKGYELKDFVRNMGGEVNANTSAYKTTYYVNSPYEYLAKQIEVLGDILVDTAFLDSETEVEKGIVIQEIDMSKDNNGRVGYCEGKRFFMGDCSYSRDALGTRENVAGFKKEDFMAYKNELYTKDNIVIIVAGRIEDKNGIKTLIAETFGRLPDKKSRNLALFARNFPDTHEMFIDKGINESNVGIYIPGVDSISEDCIACDILSGVIKWRLYRVIREKLGLCYWAECTHYTQLKYGFFRIGVGLKKNRLSFGLEKINEVIDDLVENGLDEIELKNIINGKKGSMLINYETPSKIAEFVADQYITLGKIVFPEDRAQEFSEITMEDIERILPLLKRENRYTFYIK